MKKALVVVTLLVLTSGAYLLAAPYLAANELKEALDAGDAVAIEERVDFPVLRENLKGQIQAILLNGAAERSEESPLGALAMGIGAFMVDGLLEAFVTPESIAAMAKGEEPTPDLPGGGGGRNRFPTPREPETSDPDEAGDADEIFANARYERESFDRFSIIVPSDDGRDELRFVLGRYGLSWRLRNIVLPRDG